MHCRKDRLVRSDCGAETGSTRTGYSASSSGAWWRPRVLQREPRWRPVEGECIQMTLTVSIKRSSDRSRAPKQESRSGETPRGALDGESADGRQAEEEEAEATHEERQHMEGVMQMAEPSQGKLSKRKEKTMERTLRICNQGEKALRPRGHPAQKDTKPIAHQRLSNEERRAGLVKERKRETEERR